MVQDITALGVDAGGTFTDYHALDRNGRSYTGKVNSTPENPSRSIRLILKKFTFADDCRFVHGTTVATNALLEDNLGDFVFVTNKGLEGLLDVGRGTRPDLYDLNPDPADILKFDQPVVGVDLRDHPEGAVKTALSEDEAGRLREKISNHNPDVVAVCLVHSYRDNTLERTVADALDGLDVDIVLSSSVLPRFREYERASTTAITAGLRPLISDYLKTLGTLERMPDERFVMGSNRGTLSFREAMDRPALTALSGPAGGIIGAKKMIGEHHDGGIITMDIGGTSTDVSLVRDRIKLTDDHQIGGYDLAFPMVDVHTIGSGGGSRLWVDEGDYLRVGPDSAGAEPGPACYGAGGPPTLTDAQLVLGRIPADRPLSEDLSLETQAAKKALAALGEDLSMGVEEVALGALRVAYSKLVEAIRTITVQNGHRPSKFAMVAFGGAGGLFATGVASELGVSTIYVPREAGVASASGLLTAPRYVQRSVSPMVSLNETSEPIPRIQELSNKRPDWSSESADFEAECRFEGQTHSLTVGLQETDNQQQLSDKFKDKYREKFGYLPHVETVKLVHLNASWRQEFTSELTGGRGGSSGEDYGHQTVTVRDRSLKAPVLKLESFYGKQEGPVVLSGETTTLFVPPGWHVAGGSDRFLAVENHG
ncbi:MAG: hydantoinase/oxoprolinase family protein [bacterium]